MLGPFVLLLYDFLEVQCLLDDEMLFCPHQYLLFALSGDINDINSAMTDQEGSAIDHRGRSRSDRMDGSSEEREIGHVIPSSQSVDVLNTNTSADSGWLSSGVNNYIF